jgi:3-methyl-2-oxobutanoate hydroxymethyltransferase
MKTHGEKIAVLTCYDASFAKLMESAGVEVLLVGDSLGMVLQGAKDTLSVTMQDMLYHTRSVAAGSKSALIITDMPYHSDNSTHAALRNAHQLLEAGAHMIKLEGSKLDVVRHLVLNQISVCGHLGFTPQAVHELGGYKVQGRDEAGAKKIMDDAMSLQQAGASILVLEMVPATLAKQITQQLSIPVIGIGAGVDCDGQVLVLHDVLGMYPGKTLKFTRNFLQDSASIPESLSAYVRAVKSGEFPSQLHSF